MAAGSLVPIFTRLLLRRSRSLTLVGVIRPFSSSTDNSPPPSSSDTVSDESEVDAWRDNYRKVQNLDIVTATEILTTPPPRPRKFGLDFHLVQLFFACLPSLAVYLVAQYARYEIRRMEAEVEVKRKKEEEEQKAKEAELLKEEEEAKERLSKVISRLDALEETVKEIADKKKGSSSSKLSSDQQVDKQGSVASVDEKSNMQNQLKPVEHTTVDDKEEDRRSVPSAHTAAVDKDKSVKSSSINR